MANNQQSTPHQSGGVKEQIQKKIAPTTYLLVAGLGNGRSSAFYAPNPHTLPPRKARSSREPDRFTLVIAIAVWGIKWGEMRFETLRSALLTKNSKEEVM